MYEYISDKEFIILLREHGATKSPGRMGNDCRVSKSLLLEAASRLERLLNDGYECDLRPITHFFSDK